MSKESVDKIYIVIYHEGWGEQFNLQAYEDLDTAKAKCDELNLKDETSNWIVDEVKLYRRSDR
jgi:hypothetical protein